MGETRISAQPGEPFIEITREFAAPRDLLFRAHMDPELLGQWLGPTEMTVVIDRYEPRDGGTWRYSSRDSTDTVYAFHGVFHGTPTPEHTVQTFEFEGAPGHVSLNFLSLEERDGTTLVRLHAVFRSVADRDANIEGGMERGLNSGYERLDELLARLAPVS